MLSCKICGSENAPYWFEGEWLKIYPGKGWQALCLPCAKKTPDKVTREQFEAKYWVNEDGSCGAESVSPATRKEFYSDYLASTDTLESYIKTTTSVLPGFLRDCELKLG